MNEPRISLMARMMHMAHSRHPSYPRRSFGCGRSAAPRFLSDRVTREQKATHRNSSPRAESLQVEASAWLAGVFDEYFTRIPGIRAIWRSNQPSQLSQHRNK